MGKWNDSDTAKHSGDSSSKAAQAGHDARDDATAAGVFERGNREKNSQRFSRDDDIGKEAMSFWDKLLK